MSMPIDDYLVYVVLIEKEYSVMVPIDQESSSPFVSTITIKEESS